MPRVPRVVLAFLAAFLVLFLSHYALLALPFYWDELGQFVPAALDIYERLAWVPFSTVPNVHPPGVMAYLALVWSVAGFSILHTRVAMLVLAAAALVAEWHLARRLAGASGPAWLATAFLFCCPLFFAQAEMAQLDMPAMLLTTIALALFFEERYAARVGACVAVCCAAVMAKETAILAPALFGLLLLRRRQIRTALWFTLPLIPLGIWLIALKRATGHWFGSPEFTDYNLFYPLNPVRFSLALLRRGYYLLIGSGHIIGTVALVIWLRRSKIALTDRWKIAFAFVGLHVILISVLGGAVLERYLLPALPVLYAAFGMAIWSLWPKVRKLAALALSIALLAACIVNPPYPFPMENNLAWTTFVVLQQQAARYVSTVTPNATVATSFPMAGGLRRPEMGYVTHPMRVLEVNDFRESNLTQKVRGHADALIFYSVIWDSFGILQTPWIVDLLTCYYGYVPQVQAEDVPRLTGMERAFRICAAGQCMEVFRARRGVGVQEPLGRAMSDPAGWGDKVQLPGTKMVDP